MWLASTPRVQPFDCLSTTAVGPAPHLSVVSRSFEPVGSSSTGPAPQIQPEAVGALGEKKMLWTMSPVPVCDPAPGKMSDWRTTGRMVREIRFQSSFRSNGMTGCTLSSQRSPSSAGPMSWS